VTVFGVSTDDAETQLKFLNKEKLSYTLVADTDKKVTNAFKVPLKMKLFSARRAYLFKDNVLVWKDTKGATTSQGNDVLNAIKENTH